jgi:S-adenosylmethionine:tRNA ribosyltransferase-isomerase
MNAILNQNISLDEYDYPLPDNQIAKFPAQTRDQSKLLVYKNGEIIHAKFNNLLEFLPPKAHLVFNNTKVIPARLKFKTLNDATIEIFLLKPIGSNLLSNNALEANTNCTWQCMVGNKKRWKKSEILDFQISINEISCKLQAQLIDADDSTVYFTWENENNTITFNEIINQIGQIPLPPYIDRQPISTDLETYQTVYSASLGAVAAPTAGLHFTQNILDQLLSNQFSIQNITLHVGAGTFLPIKEPNVLNHKMHNEQIIFDLAAITTLIENIDNILPVGTTSLRALESLYWFGVKLLNNEYQKPINQINFFIEKLYPYLFNTEISSIDSLIAIKKFMEKENLTQIIGETEIFIFEGYKFKLCKGIITNFHQPKSTLILLISALIGQKWKLIYENALQNNYRFLSYGDSSLLLP